GSLGAVINAPGIGPDERGHVQYIQTFIGRSASETGEAGSEGGLANVTGVEARQPVLAYLPASALWMLAGGPENAVANEVAPTALAGPPPLLVARRFARPIASCRGQRLLRH
ncbi:MAG: hypothetical protein EB140_13015, partial [Proteobacteria bacterium]|nr:hypothetical protein [Pseudomonadota bacterium]